MNFFSNMISSSGSFVNTQGNATITIGGKTYRGNSVSIRNNRVIVDGVEQESYGQDGQHTYEVIVNATNLEKLDTVGPVTVNGNCGKVDTTGSVTVEGDSGSIDTTGSVTVRGNCKGSINTVGRVTVGSRG